MVRAISLCQAGVLRFTINMDEVCHYLHSLSFVDTSGKYIIIICIFEHKMVIILYLTNKIITLWGKFCERRNTFHVLVSTSKTRQSQRELEHWGFSPLHCGIEGASLVGQREEHGSSFWRSNGLRNLKPGQWWLKKKKCYWWNCMMNWDFTLTLSCV